MTLESDVDFAPTSQPKPRQKPQFMQAARPVRGWERIAMGAGIGMVTELAAGALEHDAVSLYRQRRHGIRFRARRIERA